MRRVLRFKRDLLDLVLDGRRTATIRPARGAGYAKDLILTDGRRRVSAELVSVRNITLQRALRFYREEGFSSPSELREFVGRIYPDIKPHSRVALIKFRPRGVGEGRAAECAVASKIPAPVGAGAGFSRPSCLAA